MIGDTISHYRIVEELGAGGMGVVYRAVDVRLRRNVAIKFLPDMLGDDADALERFRREAQAASALNHPHICTVHDIGEHDGRPFLVMELMEGVTLDRMIDGGPLPHERLIAIAVQLAEALEAAHAAGIVHRDIKSSNIFVTRRGDIKVLDFGLAKFDPSGAEEQHSEIQTVAQLTRPGMTMGTIHYMSPEQVRGEDLDARTDFFSFGVVLYEMATGWPPFQGKTSGVVFNQILTEDPPSPAESNPNLPEGLEGIVDKALEKDRALRYQTAKDLLDDLHRLERRSAAKSAASTKSAGRRFKVGVAVLVAALVLGAVWLVRDVLLPSAGTKDVGPGLVVTPLTSLAGLELGASWSPDGSQVTFDFTLDGTSDIAVKSLGGEPHTVVSGPHDEIMPRWSPDGSKIAYLSDRGAGANVYWVPATGGTERKLAETRIPYLERFNAIDALGATPWSPDTRKFAFSRLGDSGRIGLWVVDVGSGELTELTDPPRGAEDFDAAWSHDGEWIAFSRWESKGDSLWLVPAGGGEPKPLLADDKYNDNPAWTHDDEHLLFSSNRAGAANLWEIEVATGNLRQITSGGGNHFLPVLSSTGRIAYTEFSHETDLHLIQVEPPHQDRQLTFNTGNNYGARFSPDGGRIAYQSSRTGNDEIWILDLTDGTERRLTDDPASDRVPDWSPDGRHIVFLSSRGGAYQLWVTDLDESAPRRLSEHEVPMEGDWWASARVAPKWSPDGKAIGYLAPGDQGTTLWSVEPLGGEPRRSRLPTVFGFDWYLDSRRLVITRPASQGTGVVEMVAVDLETDSEVVLLQGLNAELDVAPGGSSVAYQHANGHFSMNRFYLPLTPPDEESGLPHPAGDQVQITDGKGVWHVHGGAWSPDGKTVVYTRDFDRGEIYMIEGYR